MSNWEEWTTLIKSTADMLDDYKNNFLPKEIEEGQQ
jgi:hypothetical protein